jgi:hypothetical protein
MTAPPEPLVLAGFVESGMRRERQVRDNGGLLMMDRNRDDVALHVHRGLAEQPGLND